MTNYSKILSLPTPRHISLTSVRYRKSLSTIRDAILTLTRSSSRQVQEVFDEFQEIRAPRTFRLAAKLALSEALVSEIKEPVCVSVVFALYKETNRLRRNKFHPNGENFLRVKIAQLNHLFKEHQYLRWRLIMVDDGCPDGSGYIAKYILENEYAEYLEQGQIQVHFLKDALEAKKRPSYLQGLKSVDDSKKGGSVLYGMDRAIKSVKRTQEEKHIVAYTDADLSVHLGQLGVIIYPFTQKYKAVVGQRRLPDSVVKRTRRKSARGKLYIYFLKQIIPNLKGFILDPQAPLKAFDARTFKELIPHMHETKFGFDVELLLLLKQHEIKTSMVGIGFIDSNKESNTNARTTHLNILKQVVHMRKRHFSQNLPSPFESFITKLTPEKWALLTEHAPDEILYATSVGLDELAIPLSVFKKIVI